MPPTVEARTADRAIACLRKAIEELAAGRPRAAMAWLPMPKVASWHCAA